MRLLKTITLASLSVGLIIHAADLPSDSESAPDDTVSGSTKTDSKGAGNTVTNANAKPSGVKTVFLPTSSTTTTTLPSDPDFLTTEHREGVSRWNPGVHPVIVEDGWRLRAACQACDADKVREFTASKSEATAFGTPYWGFEVNREFGEINCRQCTCVHYIAQRWDKWREYRDKYPDIHKFDLQDIPDRCSNTLDVLHDNSSHDWEIDHRGEAGDNALEVAILGDNMRLAEKLVDLGEKLAPRMSGHGMCKEICMAGLAPGDEIEGEIKRFEKEGRNPLNALEYDRSLIHLKNAQNSRKWCDFIHSKELKCSKEEYEVLLPNLCFDCEYPSQPRWAAAQIRAMFGVKSLPGDEEILSGDKGFFKPWDVKDHKKGFVGEDKDWKPVEDVKGGN